jgi:predicted lipid-binding transport protein (Tim44 family)
MSMFRRFATLLLVAILAFGPVLADARPGYNSGSSYGSIGSRGSRTFVPSPGAAPIQRSVTPVQPSQPGPVTAGPAWSRPALAPALSSGGSFWHGLAGGLFGAWMFSQMFGGGGYYGEGGMPMHAGGLAGTIVMLLVVFWIGRMLCRSGLSAAIPRVMQPGPRPAWGGGTSGGYQPVPPAAQSSLTLVQADFARFGEAFSSIQTAWSRGDVEALRRFTTPEMASYFAEMLANNTSRGVANRVEGATLKLGEPRESWREGSVEYATCRLCWDAIDYTHRLDRQPNELGYLVDGDPRQPTAAEEFWTFRRVVGGSWVLSAIQQKG